LDTGEIKPRESLVMNRIKMGPQETLTRSKKHVVPSLLPPVLDLEDLSVASQVAVGYSEDRAVFVPMHYEPNYAYPLIVWLHDTGGDEHGLNDVMFNVSLRNYVAIAPRGPEENWGEGFCWPQSEDYIHSSFLSVMSAIDEAKSRFNISNRRIYLGGIGSGGEMAFRLAFKRPELFAGVVSVNGQVPEDYSPLSRLKDCRSLPVLWAHGSQSSNFCENQLCEQLRLLHIAGFSVTLRQYPCGDEMMPQTFSDIDVWIMDAINGTDVLSSRSVSK